MTVGLLSFVSLFSFNGGVTQTNTTNVSNPGIYYFINWFKGGLSNNGSGINYLNAPTDATAPTLPILELDSNGYPQTLVAGTNGYVTGFTIPNNSTYSGNWVLKWDGTGTVTPLISTTTISGSTSSGRFVFVNNDNSTNWTGCFIAVQAFSSAPNHVRNIRMCRAADEAAMDAGAIWLPEHLALMKSAKPGAIRSLGWGGNSDGTNTSQVALWSQRKPLNYITHTGSLLNPNWCGGTTGTAITTTSSGSDYTLAYSGFTLTDKVVVQLIWNANPPQANRQSITQSTTNGVAININWPSHGLAVGNVVVVGQSSGGGSVPPGMSSAQFYYINNVVDANNFTVSATSGGSSVVATGNSGPSAMFISAVARININSTGFKPVTDHAIPVSNNITANGNGCPAAGFGTIVYDSTTGYFFGQSGGLTTGSPPELFIDYCAAVGANPWLTAPFLTQTTGGVLGGVTDFMPSWVTYAKNTYPWMKPLIEPYNETWNLSAAGLGSFYAYGLSYILWPTQFNAGLPGGGIHDAYGKWVSDLGQAISAIYGNDRTKYSMLCMGQAGTFGNTVSLNINDARLTSNMYVTVNGGQPAYKWCDRVGAACYYNPSDQLNSTAEISEGFNYYITNAGNPSGQATIAEAYAASANNGTNANFTLANVSSIFTNIKAWGLGLNPGSAVPTSLNTVKGICAYEGGWGVDVPVNAQNWSTSVASSGNITKANPCVLTLDITSTFSADGGSGNVPGNPGVVGQMVNVSSVSGMTQINNSTINCTFTNTSASIAATNTLIANQAVMFMSAPPTPFVQYVPYHVISTGLSGSAFQLSATKGGSAITATANGTSNGAQNGWFVTAVGASTITLDVDSSAFSTWTSGGTVTWTGAGAYSNALRVAALTTAALGVDNTQMYTNHFALSGSGFTAEYPSNFIYFGVSGAWSVLQPTILNTTLTPQWNSIVAAN